MITERQKEALRLWAHGLSHKQIASKLGVSLRTVESHMKGAVESLGAKNSAHAVYLAVKNGIICVLALVSYGHGITVDVPEINMPGDYQMTSINEFGGDAMRPIMRNMRLRPRNSKSRRSKREKEDK